MQNTIIDEREARHSFISQCVNFDSITPDAVSTAVAGLRQATSGSALTQFDSINTFDDALDANVTLSMDDVIANSIVFAQQNGVKLTVDKIDTAIVAAEKVARRFQADSIGDVAGAEVVATYIKANILTILGADVPFAGNISDATPANSGKNNTKFQILSVEPIVSGAMGDLSKGDFITPLNAGGVFSSLERVMEKLFVTDTLTYTYDVKKVDSDTENYAMERGVNQLIVAGNIFFDDFNVTSRETTATRSLTADGIDYKVEFKYDDGQIVLTVSDNIADGTKMVAMASLNADKLSEVSGSVESDIVSNIYTAITFSQDVKINSLKLRQVLQSTGISLMSNDLNVALTKISEEIKAKKIAKGLMWATDFGEVVDVASADEDTISEKNKHALIRIEEARNDIAIKSGLTSNIVLFGGAGILKLFTALSTDASKTNVVITNETSIRFLGYINGTIPCYYNPTHDIDYPADDTTHSMFVIGVPAEHTKRIVVSGVGLPIIPDDLGTNQDSDKVTRLLGKIVVDANRDARSLKLARKIQVKF